MLEIGKSYSFKTVTFYYIGTVVKLYPTHAVIDDATEVYDTGPNASYYAGHIKAHERVPNGTMVPLAGVLIVPYNHIVTNEGHL
jgi:hypothetical protein